MPQVERTALLPFSANQLFTLVNDVEAYPAFLPGCVRVDVEFRDAEALQARLGFRVRGLEDSVVTRNRMQQNRLIEMEMTEGPFRALRGRWDFLALDATACKVALVLSLEFGNRTLESMLGPWIDRAAGSMIDAFKLRAEEIYGK